MCFIDTGIQNDGFDWCRDFALCCFWVQFWKRAGEAVAFIRLAREKAHCHRSRLQVCETKHLNRMSAAYEYYASEAVLKEGVCNIITQPHHNFIINLPFFCVGSKTGHKRNSCLFSPTLYWQKDLNSFCTSSDVAVRKLNSAHDGNNTWVHQKCLYVVALKNILLCISVGL